MAKLKCPKCGSYDISKKSTGEVIGTVAGVGAGFAGVSTGAATGATIGAAVGSIIPGAGTVIGGLVGSVLGGMGMCAACGKIGQEAGKLYDSSKGQYSCKQCGHCFEL